MKALVIACAIVLPGCYVDVIQTGTAPIGHGHGNAGGDFDIALGGEHSDRHKAYGAGVLTGVRFAEDHTFAAIAAHAHAALSLSRDRDARGKQFRPLLVGHVAFGFGSGLPDAGEPDGPEGPSGLSGQLFAGIGVGSPYKDSNSHASRGYLAVGPVVSWFSPFDDESAFWMVGAGVVISFGFLQGLARE